MAYSGGRQRNPHALSRTWDGMTSHLEAGCTWRHIAQLPRPTTAVPGAAALPAGCRVTDLPGPPTPINKMLNLLPAPGTSADREWKAPFLPTGLSWAPAM